MKLITIKIIFPISIILLYTSNLFAITSADAFKTTAYTVLRARCASCHDAGQFPYVASSNYLTAHDQVINNSLADLKTATNSRLYIKVKSGHHCWSSSCTNDANEMLGQINSWIALLNPTTTTSVTTSTSTSTSSATSTSTSTTTSTSTKTSTSTSTMTSTGTSTTSSTATSTVTITPSIASKAYKMYVRIAGVPPADGPLTEMKNLIAQGNLKAAAYRAMDDETFYNITLKNWVKPWTNVDKSNRVPLNDYVATVIGIVRDNIPFDQVIYGDHLYIASSYTPVIVTPFSTKNNTHYQDLETKGVSLKDYLTRVSQSKTTNIADSAGVLTSRAAGAAFYSAGTNRRQTRFTFINFTCKDFESLHDVNITDYRVRRDVDRKPGGDSRTYRNKCVGCHAGQDALGGAFAYFDFVNNELVYTPGSVAAKINKNNVYPDGWLTKDDSWVNTWAEGQNVNLGWPSISSGNGVRELGIMLSRSRAFAECMSSKAYELVCMRTPTSATDIKEMKILADKFQENSNYNMKNLIAETASSCFGE